MRRFLAKILIVTLLVSGFEIATDYHEALADAQIGLDAAQSPLDHDTAGNCDHCCHAGEHFTGFVMECRAIATTPPRSMANVIPQLIFPRDQSPPTRPPKA